MVQLSVNVDGKDQVKKPCEDTNVPIPEKPVGVRVKRGRRCSKTAVGITIVTILILLAVGATLLGVFLKRHHYSLKDCFKGGKWRNGDKWDSGEDSDSNSNESNSGENGHHGHPGHGDPGDLDPGYGDGPGHEGPGDGDGHDGDNTGGNEGHHLPDGRP